MPTWNKRRLLWGLFIVLFVAAALPCIHAWQQTGKYPDRLWLHRANSLEKWEEFSALYPNAEIDITVREGAVLDVTHDEPVSFGLCADRYIQALAHNDRRLWLDIKNLAPPIAHSVMERLDSMLAVAHVERTRLIIESDNAEALAPFKQRGYYTSYYVSFAKPSQLSPADIDRCLQQLRTIARSRQVCALSFPGWWYDEIHRHLHEPIDLLTWKHRTTEAELRLWPANLPLLKDPQVKVILIKSKGRFHR